MRCCIFGCIPGLTGWVSLVLKMWRIWQLMQLIWHLLVMHDDADI